MKFKNLSDGKTDGIVLFYMKNEKLHPVGLSEEQAMMLDVLLATPFTEKGMAVSPKPVEYEAIKEMIMD